MYTSTYSSSSSPITNQLQQQRSTTTYYQQLPTENYLQPQTLTSSSISTRNQNHSPTVNIDKVRHSGSQYQQPQSYPSSNHRLSPNMTQTTTSAKTYTINNSDNDSFNIRDNSARGYPVNSNLNRYDTSAYSSSWRTGPTSYGFESKRSDNDSRSNEQYRSSNSRYDSGDGASSYRLGVSGNGARSHSYDDLLNEHTSRSQTFYNSPRQGNGGGDVNRNIFSTSHQQQFDAIDNELIVKSTDLSATQEQEMLELIRTAFRKYDIQNQREIAGFLKRGADKTFQSCWHCIVGKQFSSYVTHEMNGFIYLTKGPLSILLFKSGY
ncbi:unnamed protein product [Didymodactylos carnosus]|uniref:Dynein light chain 1, cytoplasmic n=1 Tax=Didymodactylos carnosus TaxID=1234261 RepID=A0A8S2DIP0_9BILA|nr:unnamed protein product [Didymodactylos carnosus]CAF3693255.1 unnamed protein product [Didymodactylos carnosus]